MGNQERNEKTESPDVLKACGECGDRTGHGPLAAALCAYSAEATRHVRSRADALGADPVAAVDLLAHLRGVFGATEALRATCYVLDLGWRP